MEKQRDGERQTDRDRDRKTNRDRDRDRKTNRENERGRQAHTHRRTDEGKQFSKYGTDETWSVVHRTKP